MALNPDPNLVNETADGRLPTDRALAAWEIVSVVSSVLIAEWILAAAAGRVRLIVSIPIALTFVLVIASQILRQESLRDLGVRFDNFPRAMTLLLLPMTLIAIISVVIGWVSGSRFDFLRWHAEKTIVLQLALGFAWGFLQQYALQGFINRRTQLVWGRGAVSILVTAVVFAALHFPNPWLMFATLIGGLVWAWVFQRAPNLFALAVSHSVMTWVLVSTLPPSALNHLRIGLKYFA